MKSHAQLRRWFIPLNKKWFDNSLPLDTVCIWEAMDKNSGCTHKTEDGRPIIRICPSLMGLPKLAKFTLLHEMAHISKWRANHGKVFQDEMLRLANAGAFAKLW